MSFHKTPKYQIPALIEALKNHGLEHDKPSQLSDSFRAGWAAALAQQAIAEHLAKQQEIAPVLPELPPHRHVNCGIKLFSEIDLREYALAAIANEMAPIKAALPGLMAASNRVQQLEKELAEIAAGGAK